MKKIILLFIFFLCAKSFAQTNGITYQALILNPTEGKAATITNTNSPLVSKDICMLFKFVDEFSNIEYQEVIKTKTDPYGMVNLIIGTGTQTAGYATSFEKISWNSVEKNLVIGISFSGDCSSFIEISNQPFSSVPFAYSSTNALNVTGVVALENGGTNAITVLGAKTNLGLENVDNTTDLNKPISDASKLALNLKEDAINKSTDGSFTSNSDVKFPTEKATKTYVDVNIATSNSITQTLLDSKAPLESPTFTGTPFAPTPAAGTATTQIATTNFVTSAIADMSENTSTNFVDLTTNQIIAGTKIFTSDATINGVTVGRGKFNENSNAVIGNGADVSSDGITNSVAIGANAIVTASNTIQLGSDGSGSYTAVTNVNTSAVITATGYKTPSGTASQYLMANGSVSTGADVVMEIADEFNLTESVETFSLSQTPSPNSKVKMYVNGIRISNSAYSWIGTTLTYIPSNNGSYSLSANDRIQFDYFINE
ncbi:hypothetical protein BC952_1817 [Flavobacterium limicola]|uniref:Uncharacterized protein n=1 Tax=Flavobacterium limicola TaxID=180441 RepID=A0A495S4B7_9FLAO|nr:hypothetical protein [Flavobacterium limicola]RKS93958.1 hypothetical protein BC952_1817 [Flavobacterium limicola]